MMYPEIKDFNSVASSNGSWLSERRSVRPAGGGDSEEDLSGHNIPGNAVERTEESDARRRDFTGRRVAAYRV
jgi:hypothetical protein